MVVPATTVRRGAVPVDLLLGALPSGQGHAAVHAGLRAAILAGRVPANARLPSTRELAQQLGVRRNVIVTAYEQMLDDGLVEARIGAGTYVAARLPPPPTRGAVPVIEVRTPPRRAFALGRTHVDPVLLHRLAVATRRRVARALAALHPAVESILPHFAFPCRFMS